MVCRLMQGVLKEQLEWYEATLSLDERKSRGHFSTPPLLVEHMLDACGYTADADLQSIRVLDPACGSGNFLAEAVRRLVAYGARLNLGRDELRALVQGNIWGFDPDPISCFLAEMQLSSLAQSPAPVSWHIHQADGLVLPWNSGACVDLFLANPPYLAAKNMDLSGYRSAQQRGQVDSYLLFLNLGLQIVRPNGWLGLVLPDPVLSRANAAQERAQLLKKCTIHHLWHLAGVFSAQVGAVVIIAQKCSAKSTHQVNWVRAKWGTGKAQELFYRRAGELPGTNHCPPQVSQALLMRQPGAELRYFLGSKEAANIARLHSSLHGDSPLRHRFAPLCEFVLLRRGEELGRKSPLLRAGSSGGLAGTGGAGVEQEWYPVLRGGRDIRPYAAAFGGWWMAREAIVKPLERYLSPKLLVVKSTDRLQAVLDMRGYVALQTLYMLYARAQGVSLDDLYYLLALLNSRLLQQYVTVLHTAYKWVQPQIEQHVLARLPVPRVEAAAKQQISDTARQLAAACSEFGPVVEWKGYIKRMYEEQERAICALYSSALA